MKMQVIIEFNVKECDPDGADETGIERLETMAAARVCDLVQLGFMNLLGMTETNGELVVNNLMFEGEDHLLIISNPEVKRIAVVENTDANKSEGQTADIPDDAG